MFNKILIPVDFTSKNNAAIRVALTLAAANQSEVTLFHVIENIDLLSPREIQNFYNRLEENAGTKITKLAEKFRNDLNVKTKIVFGKRAEEIVKHSINNQTSLIVMASHKVNPSNPNADWGTLSYKVAILSQCPVLLVK